MMTCRSFRIGILKKHLFRFELMIPRRRSAHSDRPNSRFAQSGPPWFESESQGCQVIAELIVIPESALIP